MSTGLFNRPRGVGGQRQAAKRWRARFWPYRRRFLQVNIRLKGFKALDEIYKIYTYASLGEKNRIENEIHTFAPFESNLETTSAP